MVVLATDTASQLQDCRTWTGFGHGNSFHYLFVGKLRAEQSIGLLFPHTFSWCDTGSLFYGIGKKPSWKLWRFSRDFADLFCTLSEPQDEMSEEDTELRRSYIVMSTAE